MNKDSIELVLAVAALIIGGAGLTVGTVALAFVVGIKNSTHQVVWKDIERPAEEGDDDPFIMGEMEEQKENPNKKIKTETPKVEEEFADISDPSVTSNNW